MPTKNCEVAVKAPSGSLCDKFTIEDVEMQCPPPPLRCSVQVDSLRKQFMNNQVYKYMNCVSIPPMAMIDDVITVTECGVNSIKVNASVQSMMDTKRLTLSREKCVKMHFGKDSTCCPTLRVHDSEMKSSLKQKYLLNRL